MPLPHASAIHALGNGLRWTAIRQAGRLGAAACLSIRSGALGDPPDQIGLANLTRACATSETRKRAASRHILGSATPSVRSRADLEVTQVTFAGAAANLRDFIELLGDAAATIPSEEEFAALRDRAAREAQAHEGDARQRVLELVRAGMLGPHGYGRRTLGTPNALRGVTRTNVERALRIRFVPEASVLTVVGPIDEDVLAPWVERAFARWQPGPVCPPIDTPRITSGAWLSLARSGDEQICVGFPAVGQADSDYPALVVLVEILGGGSSSRLFRRARLHEGIAYGAGAVLLPTSLVSVVAAFCSSAPADAVRAASLLVDEVRRLQSGVSRTELILARRRIHALLAGTADDLASHAELVGRQWLLEGRISRARDAVAVNSITRRDVATLIERLQAHKRLSLGAVGPVDDAPLRGVLDACW